MTPTAQKPTPPACRALTSWRWAALLALGLMPAAQALAREPGPGPVKALPPLERNSLDMQFRRLPAGSFWMGSVEPAARLAHDYPELNTERFGKLQDEGPVHRVRISKPFWIGVHEVTVGQFRRFVEASGHVPESIADGTGAYGYNAQYDPATSPRHDAFEGRLPRYSWRDPGFPQGDDHPVVNVSWADAQAMAAWLSRVEGRRYRLPTEAEWEYAVRAGTRSRYHSGDKPGSLLRVANVFDADTAALWPQWQDKALPGHDGHVFTAPVGQFAPNAWGLHDMHGNAWEWVADWYGEDYYAHSPRIDPQGPPEGEVRVRRGGSWHSWAFYARSSFRNWNKPDTRYVLLGFRLMREADD